MHTYVIHPSAPLVFRSGKPFGVGGRDGANFPWPSSIAGALRTVWWDNGNDLVAAEQLLNMCSVGPLLALVNNNQITPLLPKPSDALYLLDEDDASNGKTLHRLVPGRFKPGTGSNLPTGLLPISTQGSPVGKPQSGPGFWRLEDVLNWQRGASLEFDALDTIKPITLETRTHVGIDRDWGAAEPGRLFQTEGLVFHQSALSQEDAVSEQTHALIVQFSADLPDGLAMTLGGERRLSWLSHTDGSVLALPAEHRAALQAAKGLVIHLATPALFGAGWRPDWLNDELEGTPPGCKGLKLRLKAVAMERWQSVSGWDLANNRPRAARKAVPAGTVYWFEIVSQAGSDWADMLWLSALSDQEQDRLNGFGLAVPGPWNNLSGETA